MADTFNPSVLPSPRGQAVAHAPNVDETPFGDGYLQRGRPGLNADLPTWNLSWNKTTQAQRDELDNFFGPKGGVDHFLWTPWGYASPVKVVCQEWGAVTSKTGDDGSYPYNATFKEVADP